MLFQIISCVRSNIKNKDNKTSGGGIGFLSDEQRLNVALTRARFAEYIVGNFAILNRNRTWRELKDDAIRRKNYIKVPQRPTKNQFANYLQSVVGDY